MSSWRAGCTATRMSGSEVRAGETDRPKGRHRAPARPLPLHHPPGRGPAVLPGHRGCPPRGSKELVAIADGYRESTDSWADLLRDLKRRDMRPPVVAVGDGALRFWAALRDVWPQTREQRDWVHK